ncbi:hypothetical protein Hte_001747 [Hypoxylon texense]
MVLGCTIDGTLLETRLTTPLRKWKLSDVAKAAMHKLGSSGPQKPGFTFTSPSPVENTVMSIAENGSTTIYVMDMDWERSLGAGQVLRAGIPPGYHPERPLGL